MRDYRKTRYTFYFYPSAGGYIYTYTHTLTDNTYTHKSWKHTLNTKVTKVWTHTHTHDSWTHLPPPTYARIESHSGTAGLAQVAAVALSCLFVLPLYANILRVERTDYSKEVLSSAIDQALGPLALVLGLMGVALG